MKCSLTTIFDKCQNRLKVYCSYTEGIVKVYCRGIVKFIKVYEKYFVFLMEGNLVF